MENIGEIDMTLSSNRQQMNYIENTASEREYLQRQYKARSTQPHFDENNFLPA